MLTGVSGRARAVREAGTSGRLGRLRWPAALVAGAIALFCCSLIQARQMGPQSDGASIALEAWAMGHGNPLLHGWYLADVTFYTTELPEYLLVELFRGLRPDVVTISAALTYTLLVLLAAAVAYQAGASRRAAVTGAAITVIVMLGPVPLATTILLNDPNHVGSAAPVLLALLLAGLVMAGGRPGHLRRWLLPVAIAVILGLAMVGDGLIAVTGILPLIVVCGVRGAWRLAVRRRPVTEVIPELSLAVAGLAAAAIGCELTKLIPAVGGYTMKPLAIRTRVTPGMIPRNLANIGRNFLELFSVRLVHSGPAAPVAVTVVHVIFACLVAGALLLVLLTFFRCRDVVALTLAVGIVANVAAYAALYVVNPLTVREMGPVFGLGAALAGRMLGERLPRWRLGRVVPVLAAGSLAVLLWALLTVKPGSPQGANLAAFLDRHDLRYGLAGYWEANAVTVETGGRVTISPVINSPGRGLVPYRWELDGHQLTGHGQLVNFMVVTPPRVHHSAVVTRREAVRLFGQPDRVYRVAPWYTVLVWRKNMLPELPHV